MVSRLLEYKMPNHNFFTNLKYLEKGIVTTSSLINGTNSEKITLSSEKYNHLILSMIKSELNVNNHHYLTLPKLKITSISS